MVSFKELLKKSELFPLKDFRDEIRGGDTKRKIHTLILVQMVKFTILETN